MQKRLVSGNFSSIPMATLITATMDLENENVDEETVADAKDKESTDIK